MSRGKGKDREKEAFGTVVQTTFVCILNRFVERLNRFVEKIDHYQLTISIVTGLLQVLYLVSPQYVLLNILKISE